MTELVRTWSCNRYSCLLYEVLRDRVVRNSNSDETRLRRNQEWDYVKIGFHDEGDWPGPIFLTQSLEERYNLGLRLVNQLKTMLNRCDVHNQWIR